MTTAEFESRLARTAALIGAARGVLRDGKVVDLAGLEDEVKTLCEAATALPADATEAMRPRLIALVDDLGRLAEELTVQHGELMREMGDLNKRQQATAAYGRPSDRRG